MDGTAKPPLPEITDDWTEMTRPSWHRDLVQTNQVGARYAVTAYVKMLRAAPALNSVLAGGWLLGLREASAKPAGADAPTRFLRSIASCQTSPTLVSVRARARKRLGKALTEFIVLRAEAVDLVQITTKERYDDAVAVFREQVALKHDRAEIVMAPAHLVFTRHALERIHDRDGFATGEIADEIRARMESVDHMLAFAGSADISVKTHSTEFPPPHEPTVDMTLLPYGRGLAVVMAILGIQRKHPTLHPVQRIEMRRGRASNNPMRLPPALEVRNPEVLPDADVSVHYLVRTYLSEEMLRPLQIRYRDLFLEEVAKAGMRDLTDRYFSPCFNHSAAVPPASEASSELRRLLPLCLKADPIPLGWNVQRTPGRHGGRIPSYDERLPRSQMTARGPIAVRRT